MMNATNIEFSTMVDFFVVEYAANLFRGIPHKIAVLLSDSDIEQARWFETVGRNRGLHINRFTDEVEAISWLCENVY
jgi:hypothetical protein